MAQMIPMLLNPETRKKGSNVGKYLLIFGALGVAIIAFIFIAKKFKPFKAVTDFFGGILGGIGTGLGGLFKGLGALFGIKPKKVSYEDTLSREGKTYKGEYIRDVSGEKVSEHSIYIAQQAKSDEELRREFRRYATDVTRALEILKKSEGIPIEMQDRISMVQSAFRKVDKVFVKDIAKQFELVWNRKVEYLKGNLVSGFEQDEMLEIAREYAKAGHSYAAKLTYMERRGVMK